MLSRRRFLGFSAAGVFTAAVGCRPPEWTQPSGAMGHELLDLKTGLRDKKKYFLGYPLNMNEPPDSFFKWRNHLRSEGIGDFGFNNVGNPFMKSSIPYNTHEFEKETIIRFGNYYAFPPSDTWGFVSHSGTDSNMHGMYIGRTILKGKTGLAPKCYFTPEAHYSIQILCDLLGMDRIFVNTKSGAGMDPNDLEFKLSENANYPALVVLSCGTTFKGAIDPINKIREVLKPYENYVHLDAALFGGYLPYTHGAFQVMHQQSQGIDTSPRYESIAISCHKFFGFPSPAGLFITRQSTYTEFAEFYTTVHNPEYIGHVPGTITCSRDAVKPAEFFYFTTDEALSYQKKDAIAIIKKTDYLEEKMKKNFPHLLPSRESPLSNTIYFRKPSDDLVKKYSLATMHLDTVFGNEAFAHIVVMPHVTHDVLDEFLSDLDDHRKINLGHSINLKNYKIR